MKTCFSRPGLFHSATLAFVSLALAGIGQVSAFADTTLEARQVPAITISGPLNSMQQVQYSTNLLDTNAWTVLSYVRLDTTPKAFYDADASGQQRFYRTKTVDVADTNLLWIPSGTFLMGSPTNEAGRFANEGPQTLVTLTKGFFMERFEVRNSEWLVYSNTLPKSDDVLLTNYLQLAMRGVSWDIATNYCNLRTMDEQQRGAIPPGWFYRLPTEAEWEYACRAGTTTPFGIGNGVELRNDVIRQDAAFLGRLPCPTNLVPINPGASEFFDPTTTGQFLPNGFGLYDMHGNVAELTWDFLGNNALPGGSVTNLTGPLSNQTSGKQFARGGDFATAGVNCRSACRTGNVNQNGSGFRVVLIPTDGP